MRAAPWIVAVCVACGRPTPEPVILTPAPATCPPAPAPSTPAAAAAKANLDDVVAELVRRINTKDGESIAALFHPTLREALPPEKAGAFAEGIVEKQGPLESFVRESGGPKRGVFRLKAERGAWTADVAVDDDGKMTGLTVKLLGSEPPVAKSTMPLGLPFAGQWTVFWGGNNAEVNYHVNARSQRRAADLVVTDAAGKTHGADGKKNEDYFAYGKEIRATADGTVTTVVDGIHDNVPGTMSPSMFTGNLVIVKHADDLYSAYAHLQPGKMRVKIGAKVKRGAVLGLCGNSGNSSEAHLHFQLQDGPLFEQSWGVEPIFKDVSIVRAGQPTKAAEYTFLKSDRVGEPTPK